jgi:translocation protein SEC72
MFKAKKYDLALHRYTMAASIAMHRPSWESNQVMREELATVLSNRSVAFLEAGDPLSALVDAEHVIALKRQWSKGHFRKSKALIALQEYDEAWDAITVGLQFDPKNAVCFHCIPGYSSAERPHFCRRCRIF